MPTMSHCSIVAFAASMDPNTTDASLLQLIIRLSWCEAFNDADLFLLYGQTVRSALVGSGGFFLCSRGGEN